MNIKRQGEFEIINEWNNILEGNLNVEKMYSTISLGKMFSSKPSSH